MSFKNKAFGFVAAAALSLGMVTGVMAADTANVDATLNDATPACSVTVVSGDIDLGTWKWNGSAYVVVDAADSDVTAKATSNLWTPGNCMVSASIGALTGSTGGSIPASEITTTVNNASSATVGSGVPFSVEATLSTTNLNNYKPGIYSGTVTVSAEAGI